MTCRYCGFRIVPYGDDEFIHDDGDEVWAECRWSTDKTSLYYLSLGTMPTLVDAEFQDYLQGWVAHIADLTAP